MQGPYLNLAKPYHFWQLRRGTSKEAFLDLNLQFLQLATSNSRN
jgi:hypothetical protein